MSTSTTDGTYARLAELPVVTNGYALEVLSRRVSSGFRRFTTVFALAGGEHRGVGEDVTYEAAEHRQAHRAGPVLPLAGAWTIETFARHLNQLDTFPAVRPQDVSRTYRPEVWLEDPDLSHPVARMALDGHRERVTWDVPIHSAADVAAHPWAPRTVNVKPSRFGTLRALFDTYDMAPRTGSPLVAAASTSWAPGAGRRSTSRRCFTPTRLTISPPRASTIRPRHPTCRPADAAHDRTGRLRRTRRASRGRSRFRSADKPRG